MMRKTAWFPANVQPIHVGVYECEWSSSRNHKPTPCRELWFNFWDGKRWHYGNSKPSTAPTWDPCIVAEEDPMLRWRGLVTTREPRSNAPHRQPVRASSAGPASA